MAENLPAFVKKFTTDAPRTLASSQRELVRASAVVAAGAMKAAAEAANTKGITVRTTMFSHGDTGHAANVKYGPNPGWVRIMNDPTKPHYITARAAGRVRGVKGQERAGKRLSKGTLGGKSPIVIKGIGPKAYAFHPGTKGKHFAHRGISAAEPLATKTYQRGTQMQLARIF